MDLFSYFLGRMQNSSNSGGSDNTSSNELASFIQRDIDDNFTIPNAVTEIGKGVFCDCDLVNFVIPKYVETIRRFAFYYSIKLESIVLTNVSTIASSSFASCQKLSKVFISSNFVPTLSATNSFSSNADGRIFIIPNNDTLKAEYQSATNWSTYADVIYTAEEALSNSLITQEEYNKFMSYVEV